MDLPGDVIGEISRELGLLPDQVLIGGIGLLLIVLVIIVIFIGYLKILIHIAAFAYPVARVRAIGNLYITSEGTEELGEVKTIQELGAKLKERGFPLRIDETSTLRDLDVMLDRAAVLDHVALEESAPGSILPFFSAFRSLYEIEQLKTAFRCRLAGLSPDEIRARMIPVGTITPGLIEGCAHAESIDEMVLHLQESVYGKDLQAALDAYHETGTLLALEQALDSGALREIVVSRTKVDNLLAGPVAEFCGTWIDIVNLNTMFRARAGGRAAGVKAARFMPGGASLEEWRLRQLMETPTLAETLHQLAGTDYYAVFQPVITDTEEAGSVHLLEIELDHLLLRNVGSLALTYHLTGGPLIRFMVARRFEVRNIRAVVHALMEGLPAGMASRFFVTERGAA